MPGARVRDLTRQGIEHRAEGGGAARTGQPGSEPVESRQCSRGAGMFQQQRPARAAQLAHDGRGSQTMTDAVPHDQADPAVVEVDDVVPVASHLQRAGGGLVSDGETTRQ